MKDANVRDLRQNLSVYLRDVERGESVRVLSRGRPVALLTPLRNGGDRWARLVAEGKIIPATRSLDELPEPLPPGDGPPMSEILDEIREDRI